jgi:hypothetical protein
MFKMIWDKESKGGGAFALFLTNIKSQKIKI